MLLKCFKTWTPILFTNKVIKCHRAVNLSWKTIFKFKNYSKSTLYIEIFTNILIHIFFQIQSRVSLNLFSFPFFSFRKISLISQYLHSKCGLHDLCIIFSSEYYIFISFSVNRSAAHLDFN